MGDISRVTESARCGTTMRGRFTADAVGRVGGVCKWRRDLESANRRARRRAE